MFQEKVSADATRAFSRTSARGFEWLCICCRTAGGLAAGSRRLGTTLRLRPEVEKLLELDIQLLQRFALS
jgi:hypothetical protein